MLKFTVKLNDEVIGETTSYESAKDVMTEHIQDLVRAVYPQRLEVFFFGQTIMDFRVGTKHYDYMIELKRVED